MFGNTKHILINVLVLITNFLIVNASEDAAIIVRYAEAYNKTYDDTGTGGTYYMSLWKPLIYEKGYCALGDAYTDNQDYLHPNKRTILVKAGSDGDALRHPTSFSLIWNDHGTWGKYAVSVYRMNAPYGYSCLGGAAVGDYDNYPDRNHYCCIRNDYLVEGQYRKVYTDKGTGASMYLGLWEVVKGADIDVFEANVFVPTDHNDYSRPSRAPYLLKHDKKHVKIVWEAENPPRTPLYLYEVTDKLEHVWDDRGSWASRALVIYRATSDPANGYYSVADVLTQQYNNENIGFLLKPGNHSDRTSFTSPISYQKIWSFDAAHEYLRVWRPNCAPDYVSLGYVAVATESEDPPEAGKIYCIHNEYVTYGDKRKNYAFVWNNKGVPGDWFTFYEAVAHEKTEQGLRAMFAVNAHFDELPVNPYLLKTGQFTYISEKPVVKVEIYDVEYNLDSEKKISSPKDLRSLWCENNSSIQQKCIKTVDYTTTKTTYFSFSYSISFGISAEVTAGIPMFADVTTTISAETTTSFESGEETSKATTDSSSGEATVPATSKIAVTVTCSEYKTNIPYTASAKKTHFDGTTSYSKTAGIFKGVNQGNCKIVFGKIVPLDESDMESEQDDSPPQEQSYARSESDMESEQDDSPPREQSNARSEL